MFKLNCKRKDVEGEDSMKEVSADQVKRMMEKVAQKVVESEPYLTEIDLKIGDGCAENVA